MVYQKISLYSQIATEMAIKINRDEIPIGSKLPPINSLCEEYAVSRATIIKALEQLKSDGLVYSIQGKGYFVEEKEKIQQPTFKLTSFSHEISKLNHQPSSTVIKNEIIIPSIEIQRKLKLMPEDKVHYLERIRKSNEEPLVIDKSFINHSCCPGMENYDFSDKSIYLILINEYGLIFNESITTIEATTLRQDEAMLLTLPFKHPALLLNTSVFLDNGQLVLLTRSILRGDKYQLVSRNIGFTDNDDFNVSNTIINLEEK